jgi:hypothetical protein
MIINNKVVCENDNKLSDKINKKAELINTGFGYIKNKDKLKHLMDIGVDLDKYHPSILKVVCDAGRDSKLNSVIKPQLELIAKEAHGKGFEPSIFGYDNKLHKTVKSVSGYVKRKYNKKQIPTKKPSSPLVKAPTKKEVKGGHLTESESESDSETDLDEVLSEIESDLEAGEKTDAECKLKKIKSKIPKKVYKKLRESIRS